MRRRECPIGEGHFSQDADHANAGVGSARGERWHRDGGVKMAAPFLQGRNSRRHPERRRAARRAQASSDWGAGVRAGSIRAAALPGTGVRSPVCGGCYRRSARPRGLRPGLWRCLTQGRSRIGSGSENARKSEGFDVFHTPMSAVRARSAVSDRSDRCCERRGTPEDPGARPRRRTPSVVRPPRGALAEASQHGCTARDRTDEMRGRSARFVRAHRFEASRRCGTRLAVATSRVRFTLGDAPGIEERAG